MTKYTRDDTIYVKNIDIRLQETLYTHKPFETCKSVFCQNTEGGIIMEDTKMNENCEPENIEENKPDIVEVEVNCDNGLVFFGTCHCRGVKARLF